MEGADVRPIEDDPAVSNVVEAFQELTYMGEWLGFNMRHAPNTNPGTTPFKGRPTSQHMQGVARSPRTSADGSPVLYVTRSGEFADEHYRGSLMVIKMASRDSDGERLRSNRLSRDDETIYTAPPSSDRVHPNFSFDDYNHPGGVSMAGDILAIPLEGRKHVSDPECKIAFFDCSDPLNPIRLNYSIGIALEDLPTGSAKVSCGAVALTRLRVDANGNDSGRFLLAVTGGANDYLKFYQSNKNSFFDDDGNEDNGFLFEEHTLLDRAALESIHVPSGLTPAPWVIDDGSKDSRGDYPFQALNFIHESDGDLYLITSRNTDGWSPVYVASFSKDYLYLFRVTGFGLSPGSVDLEQAANQKGIRLRSGGGCSYVPWAGCIDPEVYLFYPEGGEPFPVLSVETRMQANFIAGAGAYVSPTGELLYYATHHWNVSPWWQPPDDKASVSMAELHHNQVSHTGTCGPQFRDNHLGGPYDIDERSFLEIDGQVAVIHPWVQMFQNSNFNGISWHAYNAPGVYSVALTVTDDDGGFSTVGGETVVLTALEALQVLRAYIDALPDEAFKNPPAQRRSTLLSKLDEVSNMIQSGHYTGAINKLQKDVGAKADGCVDGHANDDWILDCAAQIDVSMMIDDLANYLAVLS